MRFPSILLFINIYRSPLKTLSYSSAKKWLKENDNDEIIYGEKKSKLNCLVTTKHCLKIYKDKNDQKLLDKHNMSDWVNSKYY